MVRPVQAPAASTSASTSLPMPTRGKRTDAPSSEAPAKDTPPADAVANFQSSTPPPWVNLVSAKRINMKASDVKLWESDAGGRAAARRGDVELNSVRLMGSVEMNFSLPDEAASSSRREALFCSKNVWNPFPAFPVSQYHIIP